MQTDGIIKQRTVHGQLPTPFAISVHQSGISSLENSLVVTITGDDRNGTTALPSFSLADTLGGCSKASQRRSTAKVLPTC